MADSAPRLFELHRDVDETGVSGAGHVADGVQWADGTVTMRWLTHHASTVVWASIEDAIAIHGHGGKTRIVWLDEIATLRTELAQVEADEMRRLREERDTMAELMERMPEAHARFSVRGSNAPPKCADWCYACRLERLQERAKNAEAMVEAVRALHGVPARTGTPPAVSSAASSGPARRSRRSVARDRWRTVADDDLRDLIATAILAATYPPSEWPDGPPGEGETDTARTEADAVLAVVQPELERWRALSASWHDTYQQTATEVDAFLGELLDLLPGAADQGVDAYDQIPRGHQGSYRRAGATAGRGDAAGETDQHRALRRRRPRPAEGTPHA